MIPTFLHVSTKNSPLSSQIFEMHFYIVTIVTINIHICMYSLIKQRNVLLLTVISSHSHVQLFS